jgi:hypothetical protein
MTPTPREIELTDLVKQQRRLLAGQLRITTEERAIREKIAAIVVADGSVTGSCECEVGGKPQAFDLAVYRSSRDGKQRVRVTRTR